jgi:hypothetical protein
LLEEIVECQRRARRRGGFCHARRVRRYDLTPPGLTGRRLRPRFASRDVSGRRAPNAPHEGSGPATAKRLPAPAANPAASVPPAPPYHDLRLFDAAGLPPVRAHGGDRCRECWLRNEKVAGADAGQSAQQGAEEAAAVEYGHRLLLVVCQQRSVRGHHGMATTGAIREQPVLPCTCVRTLNVADLQPAFFHTRAPRRAPHLEHSLNDAHGRLCKARLRAAARTERGERRLPQWRIPNHLESSATAGSAGLARLDGFDPGRKIFRSASS